MNLKSDVVLSAGGIDPTACAGILADSGVFKDIGVKHVSLITANTCQNSAGISMIQITPEKIFSKQLEVLLVDYMPRVVKTGMIPAKYQIDIIGEYVQNSGAFLIIDPVKTSTSGDELVSDRTYEYLIENLFPYCGLVTPNIPEGEVITGMKIENIDNMIAGAKAIKERGSGAVYLKGGHLEGDPVDVLLLGDRAITFSSERFLKFNLRGTGCRFASATASYMILEEDILTSCSKAKEYIRNILARHDEY